MDIKSVCSLVRAGANVDLEDEHGNSLLHKAIYLGNRNLFESLILLGADLNKKDPKGVTPLNQTIILNRLKMMRRLLDEEKVDLNVVDKYGFSVMHYAAFSNLKAGDIQLLALSGVDVNKKNVWGETPLFVASSKQTVQALLDIGADAKIKNRWGETPAKHFSCLAIKKYNDHLKKINYYQIVDLLRQNECGDLAHKNVQTDMRQINQIKRVGFLKYKNFIWKNDRRSRG
jgi:ankyrin repeat protein